MAHASGIFKARGAHVNIPDSILQTISPLDAKVSASVDRSVPHGFRLPTSKCSIRADESS